MTEDDKNKIGRLAEKQRIVEANLINKAILERLDSGDPAKVEEARQAVADFLACTRREYDAQPREEWEPPVFWVEGIPVFRSDFTKLTVDLEAGHVGCGRVVLAERLRAKYRLAAGADT